MAAIQEMCARIGLVTSTGLTVTLKNYYPKWLLWGTLFFIVPAVILNIGSDIAGMGAVCNLLFPKVHSIVFSVAITLILLVAIVYLPYSKIAAISKISVHYFTGVPGCSIFC